MVQVHHTAVHQLSGVFALNPAAGRQPLEALAPRLNDILAQVKLHRNTLSPTRPELHTRSKSDLFFLFF